MSSKKENFFDLKLFSNLMVYVKPYNQIYFLVMFSAIFLTCFSVLTPYLLKITVDDYIRLKDFDGMVFLIGLMFSALLSEVFFQFLFVYFANWLGQNVIRDLRVVLFKKIIGFKMAFFDKSSVGRLVTRAVNDIETIASIFSEGLFMIIADLLKMAVVIIIMLAINWELSLIVFSILPVILYATRLFQKSMKSAFEEVRFQVANLNSFVQERISGMQVLQMFNREKNEYNNFISINKKHRKAWLKTVWYNSIFFPVAEISSSITLGLLVWYGGLNLVLGGSISLGTIFLFIQISQMLFRPLRHIADKFNTLQMGMVAADRIIKIINTKSNIADCGKWNPKKITGKINVKNLRFSYVNKEEVIRGINLEIQPGEKIAIVGATGAGKSTLINLISRFYEFDKGEIYLDDRSIKDFTLQSLRKHIGIVLQDVFLFADTIYNNITLYKTSVSRDMVYEAARQIGVHEFIESLPGGYNYNVKERGVMLSSGQRQLIAFLRLYISNPSVLILDEATSSIDSHSEELIKNATHKITSDKTSILIAHRLSTIIEADRIVVMDSGSVVEVGSHKVLLNKQNGFYAQLYNSQFLEMSSIL